jgi:tetratricopeptide (TPR) repeat protein
VLNRSARRGRRHGLRVDPKAVRAARLEAGLSLAGVAAGNVSRTAIHLIETGKMKPSLETLQAIAERTGKPVSFFMLGEPAESRSLGVTELEKAAAQNDFEAVIAVGRELLTQEHVGLEDALIRYSLGRAHVQRAEGRPALGYLQDALAGFKRAGDQIGCVECLDQIACAYFRLDDPRQIPTCEEALRACRELQPVPRQLESRILGNLALMHAHARRWHQAVYFYEECLKAGSEVRNLRHRALVYDGLSLAYQKLGNLAGATTYAHKAITLYEVESDIASIALAENNLAEILMRAGRLDDAERHVQSALQLCEQHGLRQPALTYGLLTLGEIHQLRRQPDAEEILNKAIAAAAEQRQRVPIASAHQLLGRIASTEGRVADAVREFELAAAMLEELKMPERLRDCLLEYAESVEATGAPVAHLWKRAAYAGAGSNVPTAAGNQLLESLPAG